ncbi:unnamed protein product [Closterium sp. Naga37s-1]|nr:unnamed protein product [Closterium sp. Naga37s-1]
MRLHQRSGKHKDALHNQKLALAKVKSQQRIKDLPQARDLEHEQVQALLETLFFIAKTDAPIEMYGFQKLVEASATYLRAQQREYIDSSPFIGVTSSAGRRR